MTRPIPQTKTARPSPWAVALLLFSGGFAAVSITLLSTGFGLA